jgi:threonine dehydrogenase-like Zn-dependent dehydrogenase
MKAVVITPGKADSVRLIDMPAPSFKDVPGDRGVLVRVLRVGLDSIDREIIAGQYGKAPPGCEFLVLGHESLGIVEQVGRQVNELSPGDYVVAVVRHPGKSLYDAIGMPDMTTDGNYYEHGISLLHGFLREYYADTPEWLVRVPARLREVAILLEPTSVVEKGILQAFEIQRRLRIWQPRRAAVLGTGSIGLLATMALRPHKPSARLT